jgi:hypothetical protein
VALKTWLETNEIPYVSKNIREDAGALEAVRAMGYQATPVIVLGDTVSMQGYNAEVTRVVKTYWNTSEID